jgi:Ig-like domain-containing protein/carboxypeptidase family protein/CARDB protein
MVVDMTSPLQPLALTFQLKWNKVSSPYRCLAGRSGDPGFLLAPTPIRAFAVEGAGTTFCPEVTPMVAATPKLKTFCVWSLFVVIALLGVCAIFPEVVSSKGTLSTTNPSVPFEIEGFHDGANCDKIFGWAWDSQTPNTAVSVDIFDGTTKIATVLANEFRADLTSKGNGFHAFNFTTPNSLKNGQTHNITVKHANTQFLLSDTPKSLNCSSCTAPSITTQPTDQTINSGQQAGLVVQATGTSPLSYQWYRGSSGSTANPISGATSASFTTPQLTTTTTYWVRISNSCGTVNSRTVTVNVNQPDLTTSAMINSSYAANQTVQVPVTVNRTGGQLPTVSTYVLARLYWSTNSTFDSGDTQLWESNGSTPDFPVSTLNSTGTKTVNATITIPNVSQGTFFIVAYVDPPTSSFPSGFYAESNENNNVSPYSVSVNPSCTAPSITSQPTDQTINSGQQAGLVVQATGTSPLSYQWYRGSSGNTANPISGATSASFTTPQLTTTTTYWVRISNSCGTVNSRTVTVNVNTALFEGFHDSADCTKIFGWAWDSNQPNSAISVDIYDGPTKIATVIANEFRSDLTSKGNGFHAFNFTTPDSVKNSQSHSLTIKFAGTNINLGNTPKSITCSSSSGVDSSTFVGETIPDGTTLLAGQSFTKTWTIHNSGTTTWNSNYRLKWVSGAGLSNHADIPVNGTVSPGANYTFNVPMTAPQNSGTYREDWKFTNGSGTTIPVSSSNTMWVTIKVGTSSKLDKADFISETFVDGTTVPGGQSFNKTWTLRNSGTTTWNSDYKLRWVSGANLSNHSDVSVGTIVPPSASYTFTVPMTAPTTSGTFREDWKLINGSATTVPVSNSNTVWASIRVGSSGQSSIIGSIKSSAGNVIAGADVRIGTNTTQSDAQGNYSISGLAAGDYTATVSKSGFNTASATVNVPPNAQTRWDFTLEPNISSTSITANVSTKYRGKSFFLDGVTHNVLFTANVNWAGHPPGSVSFITPKATYIIPTNSSTAQKTLDMGNEFGTCRNMRFSARSADGSTSIETPANFAIMSPAPFFPSFLAQLVDIGDSFKYELPIDVTLKIKPERLSSTVESFLIPGKIPFFGEKGMQAGFEASVKASIDNYGKVNYNLDLGAFADRTNTDLLKFMRGQIGGQDFSLDASLGVSGAFSDIRCGWTNWSGSIGFKGDAFFHKKYRIPQTAYIAYFDGGFGIKGDATLKILNFDPFTLDPSISEVTLHPYVSGKIGGGFDYIFAVEGELTGSLDFKIYPNRDLVGTLTGEYRILSKIAAFIEVEHKVFQCSYTLSTGAHGCDWIGLSPFSIGSPASGLTMYQRDYLALPNYAQFKRSPISLQKSVATQSPENPSAIQTNVFPFSEPHLSSNNNLYLVWLYDDPARNAVNRSVAVFSSWDGTAWSQPIPIADNGTGDFHPRVLSFSDGTALALWEDSKEALPDNASQIELLQNVEIGSSFFNPSLKQWILTQRLTGDTHLQRSPLLAGQSPDDVMVVWIANEQNDVHGSAAKPNKLWYAKWNGTSFNTPQVSVTIPHAIVKYDFTYRNGIGDVVLALDTDDNQSTDEDRELYRIQYQNGVWGNLARLTNDTVPDENPRLTTDSKGNELLIWINDQKIYSAAKAVIQDKRLIAAPPYSTNLADFRLASTPDGRIALVWSGLTDQSQSDLQAFLYDPILDVWGNKAQLTNDAESETNVSAAFYNDNLVVVYNRTAPASSGSAESTEQQLVIPSPGTTDLAVLSHVVGGDLAIKGSSLFVSPGNPRVGELTILSTTVLNRGDVAAKDITVNFYLGNPTTGGSVIGTKTITTTLAPGEEINVSVPWTPEATIMSSALFVVVDPNQLQNDIDRSNNAATKSIIKPDLIVESVRWEQQNPTSVLLTARVRNVGSLTSSASTLAFRKDSATGLLLANPPIGPLNPESSTDAVVVVSNPTGSGSSELTFFLLADPSNSVEEYNDTNNNASLTVSITSGAPPLQLLFEESASIPDQLPVIDALRFLRGPLPVVSTISGIGSASDPNTRVMVFVRNLQLASGEVASSVLVNLFDSKNQSFEIAAEDVRPIANVDFAQVVFRLPDNLSPGTCVVKIKAHDQITSAGTFSVKQ